MSRKPSLRERGAAVALLAAIGAGGAALAAPAIGDQTIPDLSAASLAGLHTGANPALAAAVGRVVPGVYCRGADQEDQPYCGFSN